MKCSNCNNEINKGEKFCQKCGNPIKKKISIVSIILIIMLIITIITVIVALLSMAGMSTSGGGMISAVAWGSLIIGVLGAFAIVYSLALTIVSIILDNKLSKKGVKIKNTIILALLFIPIIIYLLWNAGIRSESKKHNYNVKNISFVFPKEMSKTGHSIGDGKNPTQLFFSYTTETGKCEIRAGVGSYDENKTIKENFKNNSLRTNDVGNRISAYDAYDNYLPLTDTIVNNMKWSIYEKQYSKVYIKLYGIVYKNNFYLVEENDTSTDHTICNRLLKETVNSVKYK